MKLRRILGALAAAAAVTSVAPASAASIVPLSYSFNQATDCGTWCYSDPSFTKLTDGVRGRAGWAVNAGTEWAGWTDRSISLFFNFAPGQTIDTVLFGSTQDNLSDVVLPSLEVYSSVDGLIYSLAGSLSVPPSAANNKNAFDNSAPAGVLTVGGLNITAPRVMIQVTANGPWTFTDEISFTGTAASTSGVPEPGTWAMMLIGMACVGAMLRRRPAAAVPTAA
ncbi:PEPxxWA-CTERM sorting domain-containing protein [Novosphingobium piscinae]|uniref:PEP-CTERM sorting domain-containing protein n=1 Tax=Novosphingobium piscinae TaxID=1507448 RepID=A0A7X1FXT2_9SPHN|nr:PEPxxWA-CTERM sorting domain-containing protein [Novosphingobium piscinae]MBC2668913.1 PEP-CTERM sorting domain-containing protein [Novosphingobium piscinae]